MIQFPIYSPIWQYPNEISNIFGSPLKPRLHLQNLMESSTWVSSQIFQFFPKFPGLSGSLKPRKTINNPNLKLASFCMFITLLSLSSILGLSPTLLDHKCSNILCWSNYISESRNSLDYTLQSRCLVCVGYSSEEIFPIWTRRILCNDKNLSINNCHFFLNMIWLQPDLPSVVFLSQLHLFAIFAALLSIKAQHPESPILLPLNNTIIWGPSVQTHKYMRNIFHSKYHIGELYS